eukprot:7291168-Alexandrium_andersonii.AAC.1
MCSSPQVQQRDRSGSSFPFRIGVAAELVSPHVMEACNMLIEHAAPLAPKTPQHGRPHFAVQNSNTGGTD